MEFSVLVIFEFKLEMFQSCFGSATSGAAASRRAQSPALAERAALQRQYQLPSAEIHGPIQSGPAASTGTWSPRSLFPTGQYAGRGEGSSVFAVWSDRDRGAGRGEEEEEAERRRTDVGGGGSAHLLGEGKGGGQYVEAGDDAVAGIRSVQSSDHRYVHRVITFHCIESE